MNLDHAAHPTRADAALAVLEGGQHNQASWAKMLPGFLRWAYGVHAPPIAATGTVESYQDFPSAHVAARNVDVWLPPGYAAHPRKRYPVLYMHDGQNLFDPTLSFYTQTDWGVDEAMTKLIAEGRAREAIVVGIWNTPLRLQEYMPRKPVAGESLPIGAEGMGDLPTASIVSDRYLAFIVDELKPFIDATYRTRKGRDDTFVMGSSMGGLISLYAMAEYPEVFGGAGAVSTHWPIGDGVVIDWLGTHLPAPRSHRIYYDFGTATLDAQYEPYQRRMDALMRGARLRRRTQLDHAQVRRRRALRARVARAGGRAAGIPARPVGAHLGATDPSRSIPDAVPARGSRPGRSYSLRVERQPAQQPRGRPPRQTRIGIAVFRAHAVAPAQTTRCHRDRRARRARHRSCGQKASPVPPPAPDEWRSRPARS